MDERTFDDGYFAGMTSAYTEFVRMYFRQPDEKSENILEMILGKWGNLQRVRYSLGELSQSRYDILKDLLGLGMTVNTPQRKLEFRE